MTGVLRTVTGDDNEGDVIDPGHSAMPSEGDDVGPNAVGIVGV